MIDHKTLTSMAKTVPANCPECNLVNCTYDVSLNEPCRKQFNVVRRILKLYRQSQSPLNVCYICNQPIFRNEWISQGADINKTKYYHEHCYKRENK